MSFLNIAYLNLTLGVCGIVLLWAKMYFHVLQLPKETFRTLELMFMSGCTISSCLSAGTLMFK